MACTMSKLREIFPEWQGEWSGGGQQAHEEYSTILRPKRGIFRPELMVERSGNHGRSGET